MEEAVGDSEISFTEIEDYSQYFFERESGAIIGVFVRHYPNSSERRDLVSADCLSRRPTECPFNEPNYGVADPAEREWVPSEFNLPAVAGGGCSVIKIQTDASRNNISQPECNGPYCTSAIGRLRNVRFSFNFVKSCQAANDRLRTCINALRSHNAKDHIGSRANRCSIVTING